MSREYKHYELRATKKPAKNEVLSTTVAVYKGARSYYCYVSFSEKLVQYVGKKLPLGVSKDHPAYLAVLVIGEHTTVYATYPPGSNPVKLWEYDKPPAWLNFYTPKVEDNGNDSAKKARRKRSPSGKAGDPDHPGQDSGKA